MVATGEADGTAALADPDCKLTTQAQMQFYSLKKMQDPRMAGLDFETFKV